MLSPAWTARIQGWLADYLKSPALQHELRDVAAFGALPLYTDVSGCLALRPDGRVVQVVWDKPAESFGDAAPRWRTVALVAGRSRYPELAELLPARPAEASDCANCEGVGFLDDASICGLCDGLGFVASPGAAVTGRGP